MTRRRNILLLCLLAMLPAMPRAATAQDNDAALRRGVKAAFILNFIKFTTWPPKSFSSGESPIRVAVIGNDSIAAVLRALVRTQVIGGRPVIVERVPPPPPGRDGVQSLEDALEGFHAVYIDDSQKEPIDALLEALSRKPVLTLSDAPEFARRGGMIELAMHENRVVFEANMRAIHESGVTVSSKALKLARKIHEQEAAQ